MTLTYFFEYDKATKRFEASVYDILGMMVYEFSLDEMVELMESDMIKDVDDIEGIHEYLETEGFIDKGCDLVMGRLG